MVLQPPLLRTVTAIISNVPATREMRESVTTIEGTKTDHPEGNVASKMTEDGMIVDPPVDTGKDHRMTMTDTVVIDMMTGMMIDMMTDTIPPHPAVAIEMKTEQMIGEMTGETIEEVTEETMTEIMTIEEEIAVMTTTGTRGEMTETREETEEAEERTPPVGIRTIDAIREITTTRIERETGTGTERETRGMFEMRDEEARGEVMAVQMEMAEIDHPQVAAVVDVTERGRLRRPPPLPVANHRTREMTKHRHRPHMTITDPMIVVVTEIGTPRRRHHLAIMVDLARNPMESAMTLQDPSPPPIEERVHSSFELAPVADHPPPVLVALSR